MARPANRDDEGNAIAFSRALISNRLDGGGLCRRPGAGFWSDPEIFWSRGGRQGDWMKTFLRRLGILGGWAFVAGIAAELWGRTAFRRVVQSDVQMLLAGSSAGEARFVSEAMPTGMSAS